MTHVYQTYIDRIIDWHQRHGMPGATQPPCSEDQIRRLKVDTEEVLYCHVPDQYVEFLRITNGLDFNGVGIYAAERSPLVGYEHMPERDMEGFVDANLAWRSYSFNEDYLFFAESGISLYVYNLLESRYEEQDQSCREVVKVLSDFDHLIALALSDHMLPQMK